MRTPLAKVVKRSASVQMTGHAVQLTRWYNGHEGITTGN